MEHVFSSLKIIKRNQRSLHINEEHLDCHLRIAFEGPSLSEWDASNAVNLWWKDKFRRQVGDTRQLN